MSGNTPAPMTLEEAVAKARRYMALLQEAHSQNVCGSRTRSMELTLEAANLGNQLRFAGFDPIALAQNSGGSKGGAS